jgi:hypothetical protein
MHNTQCHWLSDTYIEAEELAYNTPTGAHSRSNRHGMVRYPDGRILACTLGVPDTYFTIPAHGKLHGKYVSGYVSVDTDANNGRGEYQFHIS